MNRKGIVSILLLWMIALPFTAYAEDDLFLKKTSDSAIKLLKFPQFMTVIENRPLKGQYYFYEGDLAKFDDGLEGDQKSDDENFHAVLSDPKLIKKTLVATDLARITPSKQGEDIRGPITKTRLKKISKDVSTDIILVFRRETRFKPPLHLPPSLFPMQRKHLTQPWKPNYTVTIKTMGLVYLAKQNKTMMVPANEKSKSFIAQKENPTEEDLKTGWRELTREGLKDLAASAKKAILDKKFEVRRSGY